MIKADSYQLSTNHADQIFAPSTKHGSGTEDRVMGDRGQAEEQSRSRFLYSSPIVFLPITSDKYQERFDDLRDDIIHERLHFMHIMAFVAFNTHFFFDLMDCLDFALFLNEKRKKDKGLVLTPESPSFKNMELSIDDRIFLSQVLEGFALVEQFRRDKNYYGKVFGNPAKYIKNYGYIDSVRLFFKLFIKAYECGVKNVSTNIFQIVNTIALSFTLASDHIWECLSNLMFCPWNRIYLPGKANICYHEVKRGLFRWTRVTLYLLHHEYHEPKEWFGELGGKTPQEVLSWWVEYIIAIVKRLMEYSNPRALSTRVVLNLSEALITPFMVANGIRKGGIEEVSHNYLTPPCIFKDGKFMTYSNLEESKVLSKSWVNYLFIKVVKEWCNEGGALQCPIYANLGKEISPEFHRNFCHSTDTPSSLFCTRGAKILPLKHKSFDDCWFWRLVQSIFAGFKEVQNLR